MLTIWFVYCFDTSYTTGLFLWLFIDRFEWMKKNNQDWKCLKIAKIAIGECITYVKSFENETKWIEINKIKIDDLSIINFFSPFVDFMVVCNESDGKNGSQIRKKNTHKKRE